MGKLVVISCVSFSHELYFHFLNLNSFINLYFHFLNLNPFINLNFPFRKMSLTRLLLIVCPLVAWVAHAQMTGRPCGRMNMMQIRALVMQAITKARASLASEKQLNEYFSMTGAFF